MKAAEAELPIAFTEGGGATHHEFTLDEMVVMVGEVFGARSVERLLNAPRDRDWSVYLWHYMMAYAELRGGPYATDVLRAVVQSSVNFPPENLPNYRSGLAACIRARVSREYMCSGLSAGADAYSIARGFATSVPVEYLVVAS